MEHVKDYISYLIVISDLLFIHHVITHIRMKFCKIAVIHYYQLLYVHIITCWGYIYAFTSCLSKKIFKPKKKVFLSCKIDLTCKGELTCK